MNRNWTETETKPFFSPRNDTIEYRISKRINFREIKNVFIFVRIGILPKIKIRIASIIILPLFIVLKQYDFSIIFKYVLYWNCKLARIKGNDLTDSGSLFEELQFIQFLITLKHWDLVQSLTGLICNQVYVGPYSSY